MRLTNQTRKFEIAATVLTAESFFSRLKGLLGRKSLELNHTLWIKDCRSIHTWFMQFSIDVIFVDDGLVVRKTFEDLKPWRMTMPAWRATSVFEFPAGTLKSRPVAIGDQLNVGD